MLTLRAELGGKVRLVATLAAIAAVLVAAASAGAPAKPVLLGSGAREVWILPPRASVRDIVVFGHGWSSPLPSDAFAAWISHLRSQGSIVIYPRYRNSPGDSTRSALLAFQSGVVAALRYVGHLKVPILALGKSFGGSAIFYYAAEARSWAVPGPQAVVSVFPAYPIGDLPSEPIPRDVYVRILVGDRDTIAGSGGANAFWSWLGGHPSSKKAYLVIRSRPGFIADHDSVQRSDAAAQAVFWRPVDSLLNSLIHRMHG